MQQFEYTITDPLGVHARPAGLLVKEAGKYQSKLTISSGGKSADARKLLALMSLGIQCGTKIICQAEGEDEAAAAEGLKQFLLEHL